MNYDYQKLLFEIRESVENSSSLFEEVKAFIQKCVKSNVHNHLEKLAKQISYDILVLKRREYDNESLAPCANPASTPNENSPFDTVHHIDCLTAWTQDYEVLECEGIRFKYLKNLDAKYVIMGKDSTGVITHLESIKKLDDYENVEKEIRAYVNREKNDNPFTDAKKAYILDEFRFGFSPKDVKTNTMMRNLCHNYLDEKISASNDGMIIPIANSNIFLINCFVFLSAVEKTHSVVSNKLFKMSVKEFILPLFEIIKPLAIIQGGGEATKYTLEGMRSYVEQSTYPKPSFHMSPYEPFTKNLNALHIQLAKEKVDFNSVLSNVKWNEAEQSYFFPVNHPSMIKCFYEGKKPQGYLVWSHIKKSVEKLQNRNDNVTY